MIPDTIIREDTGRGPGPGPGLGLTEIGKERILANDRMNWID